MTHYDKLRRKKLGDLLVDEEVATKEAVITALREHHQTGTPLSEILIQADFRHRVFSVSRAAGLRPFKCALASLLHEPRPPGAQ